MTHKFMGVLLSCGRLEVNTARMLATVECLCITRHFSIVKPGIVAPARNVPPDIDRPSYASKSWFKFISKFGKNPEIKNAKQIQKMRDSCSVAREILAMAGQAVKPGVTTDEIDGVVHAECLKRGAYPSPLLYNGFPKSVCTSVNNVACHGIPDDRPLEDGDIVNIDVTVYYRGYHGDTSDTFLVGTVDAEGQFLVDMARFCRDRAIEVCGPDVPFSDIGNMIGFLASEVNFDIVTDFCGHGIGTYFHGPPTIVHVANDFPGKMKEGMTFTIEPIVTEGKPAICIQKDGWTALSVDNSRSAQAEHTILITANGAEPLTR